MFIIKGLKTFVDDDDEEDNSLISINVKMDTSNEDTNILANLIRQSQNDLDENSIKKEKSFENFLIINQRINSLQEQVC